METNNPFEVNKEFLNVLRSDSPDIRIVGDVINTLPADGTTLTFEFEQNTYKLKTLGKDVFIEGGEKGRIQVILDSA